MIKTRSAGNNGWYCQVGGMTLTLVFTRTPFLAKNENENKRKGKEKKLYIKSGAGVPLFHFLIWN